MNRPILRNDRHPMFEEHQAHDGWKIMLFAIASGIVVAVALSYGMASA